jgi:enamine deaminase RidA (YjgF/YER057c/UK114 family)
MTGIAVTPEAMTANPSFSHGVIAVGRPYFIAGQLPLNPDGTTFAPYDIDAQLDRVWHQIEMIMEAAGGAIADVARVTAWTTDRAYIPMIVEARRKRFVNSTPPASALLVVAGLARVDCLVEIDAFAVLP